MSSILENEAIKEKCQKFTPPELVDVMLDLAGYKSELAGKYVLENAFGSGNILEKIVRRYICDGEKQGATPEAISTGLSRDIHGVELDINLFQACIKRLDGVVREYNLPPVKWSLINGNMLLQKYDFLFDFIVGNPPYVTYKDIDEDSKRWIRSNCLSCAIGKFDYCYAFIEIGIRLLNDTGKMVQLIPSNIYKNVFAEQLRLMLKPHLSVVWEYPAKNMFEDALTSSSIFLFDKSDTRGSVSYKNVTEDICAEILRQALEGKWVFNSSKKNASKEKLRFGDCFNASISVATLYNKAFIIKGDDKTFIEPELLRPAFSPRSLKYNKEEEIIFPYFFQDGKLMHFDSTTFVMKYPKAAKHFKQFEECLKKRKSDKTAQWYEYGRTQAIAHLNQEKLLISTIVTKRIEVYFLDKEAIPYSGIYITAKDAQHSLDEAKRILSSGEFLDYVNSLGISINGHSKRITCRDINNFMFVEEAPHGKAAICN